MTNPIPPSLERFGDDLDRAAHRELTTKSQPERGLVRLLRRPRVLAGSSLGLAGVCAAVVLALSAGAAAPAAYAITPKGDGTVLVKINYGGKNTLAAADTKLVAEYHEAATYFRSAQLGTNPEPSDTAPGQSTNPAPIVCAPTGGPGAATPSGPQVKLLIGKDNTFVVPSGNTGGGGTEHLVSCQTYVDNPGVNSGAGSVGSTGNTGFPSRSATGTLTAQPSTGAGSSGNTGG